MDNLEMLIQKRIKVAKVSAILMIIYGLCALIFFVLNMMDLIDIFGIADHETTRTVELSTIGTCAVGVISGIICVAKINTPGWYPVIYSLLIATIVLSAFMGYSHGSTFGNFAGLIIVYIEIIFAVICATRVYKLRISERKIEE